MGLVRWELSIQWKKFQKMSIFENFENVSKFWLSQKSKKIFFFEKQLKFIVVKDPKLTLKTPKNNIDTKI